MIKYLVFPALWLFPASSEVSAQVVINEVIFDPDPGEEQLIEIWNMGPNAVDLSGHWICNFPDYRQLGSGRIIPANGIVVIHLILGTDTATDWYVTGSNLTLGLVAAEVGLYVNNQFANPASMVAYFQYGASVGGRAGVAVNAGLWQAPGAFVPGVDEGHSIEFFGESPPFGPANWRDQPEPSFGFENDPCSPAPIYETELVEQWLQMPAGLCLDSDGNDLFNVIDLVVLIDNLFIMPFLPSQFRPVTDF